jgi:hypothetical protein
LWFDYCGKTDSGRLAAFNLPMAGLSRQATDKTLTPVVDLYELLTTLIAAFFVPSIIHRGSA